MDYPADITDNDDGARANTQADAYVTKTGKVLTDADIEELAAEAERGYDVGELMARRHPKRTCVCVYPDIDPETVNEDCPEGVCACGHVPDEHDPVTGECQVEVVA